MGISHIDIAAVVPVTIKKDPSTTAGWKRGRLPSRYDEGDPTSPVEWKSLDKRLSYWLSPTTENRRWYRRPGDDSFKSDDPGDADPALRTLLDTRFGTELDADRGDEISLGANTTVGLDGIDLIRIHDGAEDNGIAVIRFLLYLPTHMPDVNMEELILLRSVLRDFALCPVESDASTLRSLVGLGGAGSSRSEVYELYEALLEPVAHIAPDDGTLPSCKLMIQVILGDDFTDDEELEQTEAMGTEARVAQLMRLIALDERLASPERPVTRGVGDFVDLPGDGAHIGVGTAGLVVVHGGDGDFIRYRDVFLLSEMQGSLITAVDNGLFTAGFGEDARRSAKLGKFLVSDPVTTAFKQMHWNGIVSTDGPLQTVYDEALRTNRIERRLASTRSELTEANDVVARGAESTMNSLLMTLAIFAFAVPIGLSIAQFQEPWPVVWMLPIGLGIGALLAFAFWFVFNRKLQRR
ncbi:hypothetical protein QE394_000743 [Arthrobacter sp. SORGH_AS 212]|uniref:hypothetical protein n=1 Tax=Pseudarthrobacter sp. SORGH_AS 212 TaxID=3041777 RepID=UPI00277F40B0|nr:hypothetical protein [Arthrobacter sp. SORGH_AS_0212]